MTDLPFNFSCEIYRELNEDLKYLSDKQLIEHYRFFGKKENRIYTFDLPYDFDIEIYRNTNEDLKHMNDIELKRHFMSHGKNENRVYKKVYKNLIGNDVLQNNVLQNNNFHKIIDNKELKTLTIDKEYFSNNLNKINDIIISLTTIPTRFLNPEFEHVLDSLNNQLLKPKKIVVFLCHKYNRNFEYSQLDFDSKLEYFRNKYPNILFHFTEDYGPITKILGFIDIYETFDKNDKIIVVDDDWKKLDMLSYYFKMCYDLYQCDSVFIDERELINWTNNRFLYSHNEIFYDNYQNFAYGWLSFSLKMKCIPDLFNFYNKVLEQDIQIKSHDDLLITLFYRTQKLYSCGIHIFFNDFLDDKMAEQDALKNEPNTWERRSSLEKKFCDIYNLPLTILNNHNYICNSIDYSSKFIIQENIEKRYLLNNIENINYNPEKNDFNNIHLDIKYFNRNIFILTVTSFEDKRNNNYFFELEINSEKVYFNINLQNNYSKKYSCFIYINQILFPTNHISYQFKIIQTHNNCEGSLNRLYSVCTILNQLPYLDYKFFDENSRINFIKNINNVYLDIYNILIPGSYKADLFRAIYLYFEGGLYFDCKNILFTDLKYFFNNEEFFVKDLENRICNGLIFVKLLKNEKIKNYLKHMIFNIINNLYCESSLHITGPGLLSKFINNNIFFNNNIQNNDWKNSYFTDINYNKIIIKISYKNYYNENNYLNTEHYGLLYEQKKVFNTNSDIIKKKINGIDAILWINLDKSVDRRKKIKSLLKNVDIINFHIEAIDGKNDDVNKIVNIPKERILSDYEIACCLSHIKACNISKFLQGNYFMICEDDISFNNLVLSNIDLKEIIENAPYFDILMLHKIFYQPFHVKYINWNDYLKNTGIQISSAACYIISRNGANKLSSIAKYNNDNDYTLDKNITFDVSDMYIFKNLETIVYQHNFITISDNESTIHSSHDIPNNESHRANTFWMIDNLL